MVVNLLGLLAGELARALLPALAPRGPLGSPLLLPALQAAACHSISPLDALRTLGTLDASGDCAANGVSLDGVAATPVPEPACADLLGADTCGQMLAIFSCEADFIPGGSMAGNCDATCHLCGGGGPSGGHRLLAASLSEVLQNRTPTTASPSRSDAVNLDRSRRLQANECTPDSFAAGAEAVSEACCDAAGDECAAGAATVCDAKCALVYIDFYESCSGLLAGLSAAAAYRGLYATCHDSLPLAPLLEAIAGCE